MSKLSIVIPVYYNEDTLELLYDDLKSKVLHALDDYEIVMVDDGSGDNSYQVMQQIQSKDAEHVKLVHLSRNYGEHAAVLAGLSECSGDCAVTKQADLQEDSGIILQMFDSWKRGNKVVLAVRKEREDSALYSFCAKIYYKLMRKMVNKNMPEGGFDTYLIDRQVIEVLKLLDENNSALTLQILWSGFKTDQIEMKRIERAGEGKSRWTMSKKIKLIVDSVMSFSYAPVRIMTILGVIFSACALIGIIWCICDVAVNGRESAGWASLMCVVLLTGGIIMLMLGILGEYIWRALDASRNRPPFIIEEVKDVTTKEKE